ncbi:RNA-guided endonuclease InsQ/TnpB family protein [Halogranum rubrum]|uniref:Transposase, IS605 OrfB family n=1 Tax=Halogranum salarium B-1 TaxID=1210908 RepID=J2ZBF8_9EURY|nr:RNA-guided endonuclease TnpB family protein [Halogranum salarium]EJN57995.1 transposase, IS605 OrfB family [Halogranum salarium B-1]
MEVRRTVPVKLDVSDSDANLLSETIDEFLWAANYVVGVASNGDWVETRASKLQSLTYDDVRDATRLHSNHVQSARNQAVKALKSVIATWKRGEKASLPTFTSRFCEYNHRNVTFYDDYATLSTVEGRVTVNYVLPDETRHTPHAEYLHSDEWEKTGATLHHRNGSFYLHIRTKADVDTPDLPENGTVLGVDLGVKNIAVTSTGTFWTANEFNHWRREYEKRRGSLQQCGTRWAHENVQSVGQSETGRFEQYLHRVANELVTEAIDYGCSYIAFENLTHIRENIPEATWQHVWAFRRLYGYVEYKAAKHGITTTQVNPRNTSRRCSSCGFTHEDNLGNDTMCCQKCGYRNHRDYNAAKNIGLKLLRNQTGAEGGAPVGVRLNSGMLNANGLTSVPGLGRAGVHAESPRL